MHILYPIDSEPSKGHSTTLANKLLQDGREYGKTREFHGQGPSLPFCYEVSNLNRSNAVWNTMKADRPFCKPTDATLREALSKGKTNPYPE